MQKYYSVCLTVILALCAILAEAKQNKPKDASSGTIGPWGVKIVSYELLDSFTDGKVTVTAKGAIKVAVITAKFTQLREFTEAEAKTVEKNEGSLALALRLGKVLGAKLPLASTSFYLGYLEKGNDTPHLSVAACTMLKVEEGKSIPGSVTPKGGRTPSVFYASVISEEVVVKLAFPMKKLPERPLLFFAPTGEDFSVLELRIANDGKLQSVDYQPKDILKNVAKGELPGVKNVAKGELPWIAPQSQRGRKKK